MARHQTPATKRICNRFDRHGPPYNKRRLVLFLIVRIVMVILKWNQTLRQQHSENVNIMVSDFCFRLFFISKFNGVRLLFGGLIEIFLNQIQNEDDAYNGHAKSQPNLWSSTNNLFRSNTAKDFNQ